MKLRTVLSELMVTDCMTGADVKLDGDVIVHPAALPEVSFPELLILASEGESVVPEGFEGTALVYEGQTMPDGVERRLARRIVHVASNLDRDAFARGFARLPELHMHLDMQRNRLFEAFQNSYDIQRFADARARSWATRYWWSIPMAACLPALETSPKTPRLYWKQSIGARYPKASMRVSNGMRPSRTGVL